MNKNYKKQILKDCMECEKQSKNKNKIPNCYNCKYIKPKTKVDKNEY